MLKVLSNILCDLDPKVKVIGQKACICDGVPSTSALVIVIITIIEIESCYYWLSSFYENVVLYLSWGHAKKNNFVFALCDLT